MWPDWVWRRRLFRNITEIEKLSELGVLFLLFEMGLELSLDRLKVSPAV
jgi:Kef-type K+ transport system membrane component KefB